MTPSWRAGIGDSKSCHDPEATQPQSRIGHLSLACSLPYAVPGGGHKAGFSGCHLARSESQPSPESVFLSLKIRETRLATAEARWPWRVLWSSAEGASLLLHAFTTCCGPPHGACHTRGERRAESQPSGGSGGLRGKAGPWLDAGGEMALGR